MEIHEHIEWLDIEGGALANAAVHSGLDAAVGHCPGWTVRDVVTHVGGVHRWAAETVANALSGPDGAAAGEVGSGPADDELIEWFRDGLRSLVATLRGAPSDLDCFAFLPAPSPLAFWARRQALETAVHRVDAEAPAGSIAPLDQALALDGIEEMLRGFGQRRRTFEPGVIRLTPEGGAAWEVSLGAEGMTVLAGEGGAADVTVAGSPSDVYLWLWNRPSTVSITGEASVADQWQQVRVRWT